MMLQSAGKEDILQALNSFYSEASFLAQVSTVMLAHPFMWLCSGLQRENNWEES